MNYKTNLNSFYKYLPYCRFGRVTDEMIENIKIQSKKLNNYFNFYPDKSKISKYVYIADKIKTNTKKYDLSINEEKYLLFMFSIDPELNAYKVCSVINNNDKIKYKLEELFGIYDINLLQIEKVYVKHFVCSNDENKKAMLKY